ncbi:hypothetical protein Nm8I071_35520 [Nonomuraea sp. TT08I-71]|nr:hypothetical protein Nm8I071_35520 [Nonomuraea sp. TT08I-71]
MTTTTGPARERTGRRQALVVRGGWAGHAPVETTDLFLPALVDAGYAVTIADDLDVYRDDVLLRGTDLVVQCWTRGRLTEDQCAGLVSAVEAGTGFAGWHGGIVAAFPGDRRYQRMVGGEFLHHPDEFLTYDVHIDPAHVGHPIVAGLADFQVTTEQYWMHTDALNDTIASTVIAAGSGGPHERAVPMPVAWTRRWGRGKVFVSSIGHSVDDLREPVVRTLTTRGLLWAGR